MPARYLVLDIETTGFAYADPIWQIGYVVVRNGEVITSDNTNINIALDWPAALGQMDVYIEKLRSNMAANGAVCQLTPEIVHAGSDPQDVFESVQELITTAIKNEYTIVTHNGLKFDLPRIQLWLQRYGQEGHVLPDALLLDSQAIVKAPQLLQRGLPMFNETLGGWSRRVVNVAAKGVKASIGWMNDQLQLCAKHGLDPSMAHTAEHDCRMVHHLLQTCNELMETNCGAIACETEQREVVECVTAGAGAGAGGAGQNSADVANSDRPAPKVRVRVFSDPRRKTT